MASGESGQDGWVQEAFSEVVSAVTGKAGVVTVKSLNSDSLTLRKHSFIRREIWDGLGRCLCFYVCTGQRFAVGYADQSLWQVVGSFPNCVSIRSVEFGPTFGQF